MVKSHIFKWPFTNTRILSSPHGSFGMILEDGDYSMMTSLKTPLSIPFQPEPILLKRLVIVIE